MVKLEILGLKRHLHEVVETLQELGSVHIEEKSEHIHLPRFLKPVQLNEIKKNEKTSLEKFESLFQELIPLLNIKGIEPSLGHDHLDDKLFNELETLKKELSGLIAQRNTKQEELVLAKKYEAALKAYLPLLEKLKARENYTTSLIGFDKGTLKALKEKLVRLTKDDFILEIEKGEDALYGALAYPTKWGDAIKDELWQEGVDEVILPSEFQGQDPKTSLKELARRKTELPKKIETLSKEVTSLQKKETARCLRVQLAVRERLDRYHILNAFSESDYTFYLNAWIPENEKNSLEKNLKDRFGEGVTTQELAHEHWEHEETPVILKNPKWLKPFELLAKLLPPPVYGTLDATLYIALGFPLFFGLILGDIGYALVLFALIFFGGIDAVMRFLGMTDRNILKEIRKVALTCATTTLIFGIIFGEFLGTLGHGWLKPIWNDRLFITKQLLTLAIQIGVLHILLGLILGVFAGLKEKNWRHVLEKAALIIFLAAFVCGGNPILASGGVVIFPPLLTLFSQSTSMIIAGILALVSWILLGIAAGMVGIIESISIVSNTLSYARLMAIGIASVALAKVANDLGGAAGGIAGFIIAVLLHSVNVALAIFDPTIQSLRLNYVEFFTKFYKSGGKEYTPFRKVH